MSLILENINRTVDGEVYLKGINLALEPGRLNVLLGRTRAGKTSLLRLIAGLDKPDSGKVVSGGHDVTKLSVQRRNVGMVYQQFINYPNLSVYDNIASPLKLAKIDKRSIDNQVREIAERLSISQFLSRLPLELSGGQQQRTALARALIKDADVVLLDEPLANLDYKLRESLRADLRDLFTQRKGVVIYATTEAQEALALGGYAVLLHEGRVLQSGPTAEQFRQPINIDAADLFSEPPLNILRGLKTGDQLQLLDMPSIGVPKHLKDLPDSEYNFAWRPTAASLSAIETHDVEIAADVDLAEISASESFIHTHYCSNKDNKNMSWVWQVQGVHNIPNDDKITLHLDSTRLLAFALNGKCVAVSDSANGVGHG